jgi:hypothetical protein
MWQGESDTFIDAAVGCARTLTFVEMDDGNSTCSAFLEAAWAIPLPVLDDRVRPGLMLKDPLGVAPTKILSTFRLPLPPAFVRQSNTQPSDNKKVLTSAPAAATRPSNLPLSPPERS